MNDYDTMKYNSFREENDITINKRVAIVIYFTNLVGPLMALGRYLNMFKYVTYQSCLLTLGCTAVISIVTFLLLLNNSMFRITKYFCLFALEVFILILAREATIGIYLCYALVPFLSCMYYDKMLTSIVNITGYIMMILALRMRSYGACEVYFVNSHPDHWFRGFAVSYTLEFMFVAFISIMLASRSEMSLKRLYEYNIQAKDFQNNLTMGFANLVECRDFETGEHIKNTSTYVRMIAEKLRDKGYYPELLTPDLIELYQQTAPLHDLGKISISDSILNKRGKLTPEEFDIIKTHPGEGARLIIENMSSIDTPLYLHTAIDMALCHHEKWDGTGYPNGLSGTNIPICARLMAAADVLDALLSKRSYKEPMSLDEALKIIEQSSGTHFEPCIAESVLECKEEINVHLHELDNIKKFQYKQTLLKKI